MIFLTGGTGTLGRCLLKELDPFKIAAPTREYFDILNPAKYQFTKDDLIVHCAAFTDLVRAEKEKELCYKTNVIGTRNLASLGVPMIYISTAYVFDGEKGNYVEEDIPCPKNFYALTKLLGESESRRTRSVVIRCLFKSRPFKHPFACDDQFASPLYADEIAPQIAWAIRNFDKLPPTLHLGGERKSTFDHARESRKDVVPCKLANIDTVELPRDVSLNTNLFRSLYGNPIRKS